VRRALLLLGLLGLLSGCGNEADTSHRGIGDLEGAQLDVLVKHFNRGVSLMERYEGVAAAKEFEEVVRIAPGWVTGRVDHAIALLNAERKEYYEPCEKELRKVLEMDPDNPWGHYTLGMLLQHLQRFDEARAQFEAVLRVDPDDPDAHCQLGTLLMDTDPDAALGHLRATLARVPHHEAALYRVFTLLRDKGDKEEAQRMLERFEALKAAGAGQPSGMKYGEMGRYADVIRAFPLPGTAEAPPAATPAFEERGRNFGLHLVAAGETGRPGTLAPSAGAFGPGVAAADVDGDGDLDLWVSRVGPEDAGCLYVNEKGILQRTKDVGIDGHDAVAGFFGDYDGDGLPDLFLVCAGPDRLYHNDGGGRFHDVT
jgi:Tfp pilus assembly protein PilF